ncbi:MAG: GNAT family N-acetyltransferase [Oligoflexales bacterium]
MKTKLSHPVSRLEVHLRNDLLQSSLRQDFPHAGPVEQEYPLVLQQNNHVHSYCFWSEAKDLIGHLNCWPRVLKDPHGARNLRVGVIGNVAVSEAYRRQGYMKKMFQALMKKPHVKNLDGFVLWTDEPKFYCSMGFRAVGREAHLRFSLPENSSPVAANFFHETVKDLTDEDFVALHALRPSCSFIPERTVEETKALLSIPDCILLVRRDANGIMTENIIVGRGCDFIGTIHEWGGRSADALYQGIVQILQLTEWESVQLIAPIEVVKSSLWGGLCSRADHMEEVPMAFGWCRTFEGYQHLNSSFFWGLDSI